MKKLTDILEMLGGGVVMAIFIGMALFTFYAVGNGLSAWLGWSGFLFYFGAFLASMIPVFGQTLAVMGAIKGLGWHPAIAILAFTWPFVIGIIFMALSAIGDFLSRKNQ